MDQVEAKNAAAKNLLIVDDDVDIRDTLADFLGDEGYAVDTAANGREALSYLRAHPSTSVVLLDLMMPVMDGFQFRAAQKDDPAIASIPVVVMTARGALEPGAIDVESVLAKPLNLAKLLETLRRMARSSPLPGPQDSHPEPESGHAVPAAAPDDCMAGGGEMGALMRSMDWSRTALGPADAWPQSLRTSVSTCLNSRFPILLWWGPDMVKIYNDAYRPILGAKHPGALGARGRDVWPEIWHIIGPMLEGVLSEGRATWSENQLLLLERHGFPEECYFTFSYSPIRDESGGIGGIFCAVTETTGQVLSERRLSTLRDLAERAGKAAEAEEVCRIAADVLRANAADVPFALMYLLDRDDRQAMLAGMTGLPPDSGAVAPVIDLADGASEGWPLAEAARAGKAIHLADLDSRFFGPLPIQGDVPAPRSALVLPVRTSAEARLSGLLVAGLSPRLALDEGYRSFLDLVVGHIATAIGNVRALQEARQRAEALAELDRVKTAFFSNVSHEFRTPLTLMLGPLEGQLEGARGPLPAALREDVETVHRNAVRLLKLVNTLLDFSQLEAGRVQAAYEPTDLSQFTADLASIFRSATERAGLALKVDCPPLPELVYVDREMWEKIVLNLVSNALKFTFEGEIAVSLRREGDCVKLLVRDTGTGIPPEEIPHIFQRFHRVQGARARTQEGSGIGLALVQELVKLHGGTVQVDSQVGEGAAFTVSIPAGCAHLPAEHVRARPALAPASAGASAFADEALRWLPDAREAQARGDLGRDDRAAAMDGLDHGSSISPAAHCEPAAKHILLADDNADMRAYIRRLLLPQQWTVEAVANGAAALDAARARLPDIVLTDVMMPGLDGFGLLRALRADPRTRAIPVIMLSARAGEEARVEGLEAGADDYLVKPFSARELVARIGSQLALANLRKEVEKEREVRLEELGRFVHFSDMFIGTVCHDLRSPLAAIMTAATVLEHAADPNKAADIAPRILRSAERMQRMIGQLLDFTSARLGGGIPLLRGRADLAAVCRQILDERQGGDEQLDVRLECSGDLTGNWDADRLGQLVSNLLGNALEHRTPDSAVLLRLAGLDPQRVRLEIHNSGAIPEGLRPVIFEPFRSGRNRRSSTSGLGLGLFITREITLAHGGTIEAYSSEAEGTRFVVELPRKESGNDRPA